LRRWRGHATRGALLVAAAISFYFMLPGLLEVFTSWRSLRDLEPAWVAAAIGLETASFLCTWALQRVALGKPDWFAVSTSQLAGNALGRVIPGGAAAASAVQYRMLQRAGASPVRIASGLAAASALLFASLFALPVLAVPAILRGTPIDALLERGALMGAAAFVLMLAVGIVAFAFDRPLRAAGRAAEWALRATRRWADRADGLSDGLLAERDTLLRVFGADWKLALAAALARWLLDFFALVAVLYSVGADPNVAATLLAYVTATILGQIPITPGGLGFVEAGLTGTLALVGVGAGPALTVTLAYRLISFWLPIPVGGIAYGLFRRRYGTAAVPPLQVVASGQRTSGS
jgi:hypothetical protein